MVESFNIIENRKIFFIFSAVLIVLSVAALLAFGLRFNIEFTGGSQLEVRFSEGIPSSDDIHTKLSEIEGLGEVQVQPRAQGVAVLRMRHIDEETHTQVLSKLSELSEVEELQFTAIGPTIGKELRQKGIVAVLAGIFAIMVYIAWAFRKASRPVASWQYGTVAALVGLFHDVLLPVAAFAALGKIAGFEVGAPFIAAILTVLGFSVHDTIVVFDRTRENLRRMAGEPFEHVVNVSLNQTIGRSLNTSLTLLIATAAIWVFAGEGLRPFAAVIFIGSVVGTYSSIFIASPLLVELARFKIPRRR